MYRVTVTQGNGCVNFYFNDEYMTDAVAFASTCLEVGKDNTSIEVHKVESEDD